jgi:catechol 2,3-dioxygenase-like lactoylglutathione lyase family enzyme
MARFHHVNLGVPIDGIDDEARWLVEVLGYQSIDAGPERTARGATWFVADDGTQVHLSRDEAHRPAAKAHVAIEFDDLAPVRMRIEARGDEYRLAEQDELTVLNCVDPAGNLWELRQPAR